MGRHGDVLGRRDNAAGYCPQGGATPPPTTAPKTPAPRYTPKKFSTTSTPCCTARPTASATPAFCAPTSRASPSPPAAPLFDALAALGAELVAWHLLEHPNAQNIPTPAPPANQPAAWFGTDYTLVKVAELAPVQGSDDAPGKVYINATSGFAQVRQHVWQHSIGGYQVLHKWLDRRRRKAGRSLSQQDFTHWQRIYAACQTTQTLMQQVDTTIQTHGNWPTAFSPSHAHPPPPPWPPNSRPKNSTAKPKRKSRPPRPPRKPKPYGGSSLFHYDEDLEPLARAAGVKPGGIRSE